LKRHWKILSGRSRRLNNIATVDTEVNGDLKSFLETAAFNVGLSFKCFTDIDAARNWLKRME